MRMSGGRAIKRIDEAYVGARQASTKQTGCMYLHSYFTGTHTTNTNVISLVLVFAII